MTYKLRTMQHLKDAFNAASQGKRRKALKEIDRFDRLFSREWAVATPLERLQLMAFRGRVYVELHEWEMAALKLEEVCAYADEHYPNTLETAGDYVDLSRVREKKGDLAAALDALEKAAVRLKAAGEWDRNGRGVEAHLAELHSRMKNEPEQI